MPRPDPAVLADLRRRVEAVAVARSDLMVFAAVQLLMEGGLVSSASFRARGQIVAICEREQAKCLARYDRALLAALEQDTGRA